MQATIKRIEEKLEHMEQTDFTEDVKRLLSGIKTMERIATENSLLMKSKLKELEVLEEKNIELLDLLNHYRVIINTRYGKETV